MSPDEAQTRLIASIARHSVSRSPPTPPYSAGNGSASTSWLASSSLTSHGNSAVRSISAARGAIRSSASNRTASRYSSCSSVSR